MISGDASTIAVLMLSLRELDDGELAAFNLAVNGRGVVAPINRAYRKALDLRLIQVDGSFNELLKDACALEVKRRFPDEWAAAGRRADGPIAG